MDPCPICGAAHAPAAAGEVCSAACIKALASRVAALEQPTVRGVPFVLDPATTDATAPVVSLGGSAGGAGGMK